MRFHLSDEQDLLRDSLKRAISRAYPPTRRRAVLDAPSDFDADVWRAIMDVGVVGILVPEAHGGAGLGLLDAALACEVLGEMAVPGPILGHLLATLALVESGDDEAAAAWLPRLASGETVATFAFGPDWDQTRGCATLTNRALNGEAPFVLGADRARLFIVSCADGVLALVERSEAVEVAPCESIDRTRRLSRVRFNATPCTILTRTTSVTQRISDAAAILIAADALGGGSHCLALSIEYAFTRRQFDRAIASFQAIRHELADMAVALEPARALVWYAAYAFDAALPEGSRAAAQAKAHLCDRFTELTRHATQIHGGIGYTWEYELQIWFRRALFDHAFLGAPKTHRARAAALGGW